MTAKAGRAKALAPPFLQDELFGLDNGDQSRMAALSIPPAYAKPALRVFGTSKERPKMGGIHPKESHGFSLVECLTSIGVLAVLVTAGIPSFSDAINSWKLTTAANETLAAWQIARLESIKSNQAVIVCASNSQDDAVPTCSEQSPTGWIAFSDSNGNRHYEAEEQLLRTARLPRGIRVFEELGSRLLVAFRPDGFAWSQDGEELLSLSARFCLPGSRSIRRVALQSGSKMVIEKLRSTSCEN